jgi:hypothetical protein
MQNRALEQRAGAADELHETRLEAEVQAVCTEHRHAAFLISSPPSGSKPWTQGHAYCSSGDACCDAHLYHAEPVCTTP